VEIEVVASIMVSKVVKYILSIVMLLRHILNIITIFYMQEIMSTRLLIDRLYMYIEQVLHNVPSLCTMHYVPWRVL